MRHRRRRGTSPCARRPAPRSRRSAGRSGARARDRSAPPPPRGAARDRGCRRPSRIASWMASRCSRCAPSSSVPSMSKSSRSTRRGLNARTTCPAPGAARKPRSAVRRPRRRRARRARRASACSAGGSRRARSAPRRGRCGSRRRRCRCRAREASTVNGMPSASAVSCSSSKTRGLSVAPRAITGRCRARACPAPWRRSRGVGGVGHVDHDRDVGLERVGRCVRAREGDLLLRRRHRRNVAGRAARLRDQPRGGQRDVGAEPVVERARGEPAVGSSTGSPAITPRRRCGPVARLRRRRGRRRRCAGRGSRRPSCAPHP